MKAVFADTFYWAALTNVDDPANARALNLSRSLVPDRIVTTDEVLAEYLTFFPAPGPEPGIEPPGMSPSSSRTLKCALRRRAGNLSLPVCDFTALDPTRVSVWSALCSERREPPSSASRNVPCHPFSRGFVKLERLHAIRGRRAF